MDNLHEIKNDRVVQPLECIEQNEKCEGEVVYCEAPSGSRLPRCEYHDHIRWSRYLDNQRGGGIHERRY